MIVPLICKYFFLRILDSISNYTRPIELMDNFAHVYSTSCWLYLHVFRRNFVDDFCLDNIKSIVCKNLFEDQNATIFLRRNLISDYISIIWKPMVWADGWKYSWDDNEYRISKRCELFNQSITHFSLTNLPYFMVVIFAKFIILRLYYYL